MKVSASGGDPEPVVSAEAGAAYKWPQILPGGRTALLSVATGVYDARVAVVDLETGDVTTLLNGDAPRYVPSGHIVFSTPGSISAAPFDVDRIEVTGPAVPILGTEVHYRIRQEAAFAISQSGALLYAPSVPLPERSVVSVDFEGQSTPIPLDPVLRQTRTLRLSPDGNKLLTEDREDVWIYDLVRGTSQVLSSDSFVDFRPIWTPDRAHVVFTSNREGAGDIFRQSWDGSAPPVKIVDALNGVPSDVSPDGTLLLYMNQGSGGWDVWVARMDGSGEKWPLLQEPYTEFAPVFSSDGRFVAYSSAETGQSEVYVQPFPGPGRKQAVSRGGGLLSVWAPDDSAIFYWKDDALMSTTVRVAESEVEIGVAEQILKASSAPQGLGPYDIHPDGKRFILYGDADEPPPRTHLVVIERWTSELSKLAPAKP